MNANDSQEMPPPVHKVAFAYSRENANLGDRLTGGLKKGEVIGGSLTNTRTLRNQRGREHLLCVLLTASPP